MLWIFLRLWKRIGSNLRILSHECKVCKLHLYLIQSWWLESSTIECELRIEIAERLLLRLWYELCNETIDAQKLNLVPKAWLPNNKLVKLVDCKKI